MPEINTLSTQTIRRRLALGVVPYLVLAPKLKKKSVYRANKFYSWTRDLLAAAVGTGLLHPVFTTFSDLMEGKAITEQSVLSRLPAWLVVVASVCLLLLVSLKVVIARSEAEKLAVLTDNCCKEFGLIRNGLNQLLQSPNPLPGLTDYQNRIAATVDRLINEDCWPFEAGFAKIQTQIDADVQDYYDRFSKDWTSIKESDR